MQKKQLRLKESLIYLKLKSKIASFSPVNRNGWLVKFSVLDHSGILLIFTSTFTGQTILRYFEDEERAVEFINFIIHSDPSDEVNEPANP